MATPADNSDRTEQSTKAKTFIRKALELFRHCDKSDNGFISKRDMWKLSNELSLTPEQLDEIFISLDEDRSGYLTEEEFIGGFASYLGVDLDKLKKEEEEEAKHKTEEKENQELEELLDAVDENADGNEEEVENLWSKLRKNNPELSNSEFESVIEDLGKGLSAQAINKQKEVRKDFFSLHKYYYQHINAVMQNLETGKLNNTNGQLCEPLDSVKINKHLTTLSQGSDRKSTRLNYDSTGMVYDEGNLPTRNQELLISPPIKARKKFLKSAEELTSQEESFRKHNPSKSIINSLQQTDYLEYRLSNNHILPVTNCPERLFKIIFLGDSGVGKTSFIHRFCCGQFLSKYQSTFGIDYRVKTFAVNGHMIALQLWDTAGQERYRTITSQYFRKTDGIIFMYDVTSELSFRNVRNWMAYVEDNSSNNLIYAIVGNKLDLSQKERQAVATTNGEELAKKHESLFYETSCRTGEGIWNIMSQMASALQLNEDREIERTRKLPKIEESKKCC